MLSFIYTLFKMYHNHCTCDRPLFLKQAKITTSHNLNPIKSVKIVCCISYGTQVCMPLGVWLDNYFPRPAALEHILYNYRLRFSVNIRFYGPNQLYSPRQQAEVNIGRSGPQNLMLTENRSPQLFCSMV